MEMLFPNTCFRVRLSEACAATWVEDEHQGHQRPTSHTA